MVLDDLVDYLAPLVAGTPLQKGFFQALPDTAIALMETGGFPSQHVYGGTLPLAAVIEEPTIQVKARAKDYLSAMSQCRLVYRLLDGLRDLDINGVTYHFIRALQPPFFLMRDEVHRFVCAFNIHVQRRSVA